MAKTTMECKQLGCEVANFSYKHWADNAKKLCMKGLDVKFLQNPCATQVLLATREKKLVECIQDHLWGTGTPPHQPDCSNQKLWCNQGLLTVSKNS